MNSSVNDDVQAHLRVAATQIQRSPAASKDDDDCRVRDVEILKSYARFHGKLADWRADEDAVHLSVKAVGIRISNKRCV